jgi:hypothetical protein
VDGGRTWWAHFAFTRINTTPTILPKKIEESLRNEPKTSRVGKCVGYLDLRAFQCEGQTGGGSSLISGHHFRGYRSWPNERPAHTNAAVRRSSPGKRVGLTIDRLEIERVQAGSAQPEASGQLGRDGAPGRIEEPHAGVSPVHGESLISSAF